ncbi:hypothetical protein QQX98_008304 [Neonectria punicea]|uniref:Uncharacterized protein n=1 Tax=Neonectria punicea TaxID=979145 RepID=A0ABR1GVH5_9HYPO
MPRNTAAGDGSVSSAYTDIRDISPYVARIISDPRTLNKMVFAYGEVTTTNQTYELLEKLSGKKIDRNYVQAGLAQVEGSNNLMDLSKL